MLYIGYFWRGGGEWLRWKVVREQYFQQRGRREVWLVGWMRREQCGYFKTFFNVSSFFILLVLICLIVKTLTFSSPSPQPAVILAVYPPSCISLSSFRMH